MTWSEDFAIAPWRLSHDCFFIYKCACYVLSIIKRSLCIIIYYWGQILCPLYGIGRNPQLGGFLSTKLIALQSGPLRVSAIWRCPLLEGAH